MAQITHEDELVTKEFLASVFNAVLPLINTSSSSSEVSFENVTVQATTDDLSSDAPTVQVSKTGTDEAPVFTFAFSGLKGSQGATGATGPQGPQGPAGTDGTDGAPGTNGTNGTDGADGKSAYEIAVDNGFTGTEVQWLASLKGETGATGAQGPQGPAGADGAAGATGAQGPAGQGVPTGGTTGQVLKKSSNTDYDAEWADEEGGSGGTSDFDELENRPEVANDLTNVISSLPITPRSTYMPNTGYTPVGTIISLMGNTAPRYYLACDGTEYNIIDYPVLAEYFKEQFGSYDKFGGNGTTTFAVPDLQGEFLRGTGTNKYSMTYAGQTLKQGNGAAVGTHQHATVIPHIYTTEGNLIGRKQNSTTGVTAAQTDTIINSGTYGKVATTNGSSTSGAGYTARPTNTSVLFCIAYQNIYIDAQYNYSTDEQIVGTWVDGKPLYQKTIEFNVNTYTDANKRRQFALCTLNDIDMVINSIVQWQANDTGNYLVGTTFRATNPMQPQHTVYAIRNGTTNIVTQYFQTSVDENITKIKGFATIQYTKLEEQTNG